MVCKQIRRTEKAQHLNLSNFIDLQKNVPHYALLNNFVMNDFFRKTLNQRIKKALLDATNFGNLKHPYLIGKLREILLDQLIEPLLNKKYSTGTGKILDYKGSESKEIDICIFSHDLHPPLFFSSKESLGVFPIESVLSCIEVKSTFTKSNLISAYRSFKYLEDNLILTSGHHDQNNIPHTHLFLKHNYSLFAFKNGARKTDPDFFLKLYREIDPLWNQEPLISNICIAGTGWLCFSSKGWLFMPFDQQNDFYEEVVGFLCTTVQSLFRIQISRGDPRIGYYLTDPSKMGRFDNNDKYLPSPWIKGEYTFSNDPLDFNK